jgi:hypothetical protein
MAQLHVVADGQSALIKPYSPAPHSFATPFPGRRSTLRNDEAA